MFKRKTAYPDAADATKVGTYDTYAFAGGGYFYDEVLEYRVWVKDKRYQSRCYSFATYILALKFSRNTENSEPPLVLVLQKEHINEPKEGIFEHIKKSRITEWQPDWLEGNKRFENSIPEYIAKNAK